MNILDGTSRDTQQFRKLYLQPLSKQKKPRFRIAVRKN